MPARGRKPTAAMPAAWQPAPAAERAPLPTAPPGWLIGRRKTAWKAFEPCDAGADWAEPDPEGGHRRKVIKIQCEHRRASKHPARAEARGEAARLDRIYASALIVPCQYTECPQWVARHPESYAR